MVHLLESSHLLVEPLLPLGRDGVLVAVVLEVTLDQEREGTESAVSRNERGQRQTRREG